MHLSPTELTQQSALAFMRHQDLIAEAQRYRLVCQANGQVIGQSHRAPVWRRWLGRRLIAWGHALQASSRPHRPVLRGPVAAGSMHRQAATRYQTES